MAQLKQCPNGHYYDPSTHPTCPYCSGVSTGLDRSVDNYDIRTANPSRTLTELSRPGETVTPASAIPSASVASMPNVTVKPTETELIDDYNGATRFVDPGLNRDRGKDSPEKENNAPQKFVVGWLVAITGPYEGKSFELHHGYTYIGREKGDIVLKKDDTVSGEKNASILYSPKNNRFKIGAGQSTNVVYVNDDELFAGSNVDLNPYDLIEIGQSKFRFVPFCSDQFKW
jgi:hypothetical protein